MNQYCVTAKLGPDYCSSCIVYAGDIADAVREGCAYFDIASRDVISVVRITDN